MHTVDLPLPSYFFWLGPKTKYSGYEVASNLPLPKIVQITVAAQATIPLTHLCFYCALYFFTSSLRACSPLSPRRESLLAGYTHLCFYCSLYVFTSSLRSWQFYGLGLGLVICLYIRSVTSRRTQALSGAGRSEMVARALATVTACILQTQALYSDNQS